MLENICNEKLSKLGLAENQLYVDRLKEELQEIKSRGEEQYFLNLKDKYENENNLLVPYLLDICEDFDIKKPTKYDYGDMPDVDVDIIPVVRSYIKEQYVYDQYGEDYVCNIATYTTFGLRSALIDMAKVFDLDRKEIISLTTKLGIKDDEGAILTWDKALELYDDLRNYLEKYPEMAKAAKHILNRNRNMGVHASGLIISNKPIKEFVPLVRGKDKSKPCSAWVEGLHGTDLGAVGLIKFDFLSLEANMKIAVATRIASELSGGPICALPGKSNWTDLSYLEDKKSLEMANRADLKMVFQYDGSEGIRRLARQGGVSSFNDLVAYTAIFRPATLKLSMHNTYCDRKNGKEEYEIHPLLQSFMGTTYGVLCYQEQTLRMLNVVGKIPLKDCEDVRKAISKKKIEKFKKYKEIFVTNGQETLGWTKEQVEHLWDQIEAFSGYGFNCSHATAYGVISAKQLYLKANHPLAFYVAGLSSAKAGCPEDYKKLKDYKQEAERHGIKVNRIDINKSGADFKIFKNEIYYGFSKIRGIGEEAAAKIERLQPYENYEDFLKRYGTDAKINQALLALRAFDGDPVTLYKFYETFKLADKRNREKVRRFNKLIDKCKEQLNEIRENGEDDSKIVKKMNITIENFQKDDHESLPTLSDFFMDAKLNEEFIELLENKEKCEQEYYGFIWSHPIEKCEKYTGKTVENYTSENTEIGPIEAQILSVTEKKGPKVTYYSIELEDANGDKIRVNVWNDDYQRFKDELIKGQCLRMQLKAPSGGFFTYSLAPLPNRYRKPPKEFDNRIIVLK